MQTTIHTYIHTHQLLTSGQPVVVGVSGGADSVALLTVLVRLGFTCVAAHCNFRLRGEESDRDEQFVVNYATQLGVPFHRTEFDTRSYATTNRMSVEMAARKLRYDWFESLRQSLNAQAVAVAHHRDDSVETMLMNMIRGTGIRGMCGIRPRNGHVVRPLLCVSREDILDWLADQQLDYVTDSTNLQDDYTRNFIRLNILPLLEKLNPSVRSALARTGEHLSAAERIYLHAVEDARRVVMKIPDRLSIDSLMHFPEPATLLYELLLPYGVSRTLAHDLYLSLSKQSGKEFFTLTHRLVKDRQFVLIISRSDAAASQEYVLDMPIGYCSEPIPLSFHVEEVDLFNCLEKKANIGYFDYDKLQFPLTIRRWVEGDWFVPFGMTGRKKLSDYFSDRKFSKLQKEQTWLLCSGNEIIWIISERTDNRFRIEISTKRAFIVKNYE